MEYFFIAFGVLLIFIIIRGFINARSSKKALYEKLQKEYGSLKLKDYSRQGINHRSALIKRRKVALIDEITWNDLELEKVFERIDRTHSAIGEEYLYYYLHVQGDNSYGKIISDLADIFDKDENLRNSLLVSVSNLGYVKKLSPFDYLDYLTSRCSKSIVRDILLDILFVFSVAFTFFKPLYGAVCVFIMLLINLFVYFKDKRELDDKLAALSFLVRLSKESLKLAENDYDFISDDTGIIKDNRNLLKNVITSGRYLIASGRNNSGGGTSSSPVDILLNYVNMIFHIDLIQYRLLLGKLSGKKFVFESILDTFGRLDCALSVASFRKSLAEGYCRPEFISIFKKAQIHITEGYHPLISKPVTNSIDTENSILLTGSNASGKSTFLRMVAVNALLAQNIGTVCAAKYAASVYNIYSSIALTDNLLGGESYFIVEIKSLKRILDAGIRGESVLCFIDEVLRGTNTTERICASKAVLSSLSEHNVLCFAATHDGELTQLLDDSYTNYHFSEDVSGSDIKFDFRLKKGPASSRNALKLLKIYGYPEKLIDEAEIMAHKLDSKTQ